MKLDQTGEIASQLSNGLHSSDISKSIEDSSEPLPKDQSNSKEERKFSQIFLEWQQLNYAVTKLQDGKVEEMPLLNDVSGFANPGEILAIMGPSGAGKTTLLNLLCNSVSYDKSVKIEGTITANGTSIKDFSFKDYIGYVTQEDILMTTMTCRESLTFAATLKIPASKDKIKALVDEMLQDLKLTHVADNIIGGNLYRGISGGERKRVAIGIEIISELSILFLDEPTSGLYGYKDIIILRMLLALSLVEVFFMEYFKLFTHFK